MQGEGRGVAWALGVVPCPGSCHEEDGARQPQCTCPRCVTARRCCACTIHCQACSTLASSLAVAQATWPDTAACNILVKRLLECVHILAYTLMCLMGTSIITTMPVLIYKEWIASTSGLTFCPVEN